VVTGTPGAAGWHDGPATRYDPPASGSGRVALRGCGRHRTTSVMPRGQTRHPLPQDPRVWHRARDITERCATRAPARLIPVANRLQATGLSRSGRIPHATPPRPVCREFSQACDRPAPQTSTGLRSVRAGLSGCRLHCRRDSRRSRETRRRTPTLTRPSPIRCSADGRESTAPAIRFVWFGRDSGDSWFPGYVCGCHAWRLEWSRPITPAAGKLAEGVSQSGVTPSLRKSLSLHGVCVRFVFKACFCPPTSARSQLSHPSVVTTASHPSRQHAPPPARAVTPGCLR